MNFKRIRFLIAALFGALCLTGCGNNSGGDIPQPNPPSVETTYKITWENYDYSILYVSDVKKGTTPVYKGSTPTRASTEYYSYEFKGWSPSVSPAYRDQTYVATYKEKTVSYTVTFYNYDHSVLQVLNNVSPGTIPNYTGDTPTKPSNGNTVYTFKGWSPSLTACYSNQEYTATYRESKVNQYNVNWLNYNGDLLLSELVNENETPSYTGNTPVRESNNGVIYTFTGWNPAPAPIHSNMNYVAQFSERMATYTVKWVNYDGTLLEQDNNVTFGSQPTYNGNTPTRPSTSDTFYTFDGWNPELSPVYSDITYKAKYKEGVIKPGVKEITFTSDNGLVPLGSEKTIEFVVSPSSYKNDVKLASYDESIVSVSGNKIYGVGQGKTKIIAYGSNGFYREFDVRCYVPFDQFKYYTQYVITYNEQGYWKAIPECTPTNADLDIYTYSFKSSNPDIIWVDESTGFLSAIRIGYSTLTVTITAPSGKSTSYETLFYCNAPQNYVEATSFSYDGFLTLSIGQQNGLSLNAYPEYCYRGKRTYTSSDERIATVASNGYVTGVNIGRCVITMTSDLGYSASYQVVVNGNYAKNLSSSLSSYTLAPGQSQAINYNFSGNSDTAINFRTTNDEVAIVKENRIVAISSGTCKLIGTLLNGETITADVNVTASISANSISLNSNSITLKPKATGLLSASIAPSNANKDTKITWESSNSNIASVNNGLIVAKEPGKCTITASLVNGAFAECEVTVLNYTYPTSISLDKKSLSLDPRSSSVLIATILPSDCDIDNIITWSSSNSNIATVTAGVVTAIAPGKCEVVASLPNGLEAVCNVTVLDYTYVTKINVTLTSSSIYVGETQMAVCSFEPYNFNAGYEVEFYSSDDDVATVDGTGLVTGINPGTCQIYAQNAYGVIGYSSLTVKPRVPAEACSFVLDNYSVKIGSSLATSIIYSPAGCNAGLNVTYSSENENIVKIDNKGIITGVSVGTCEIYVELENGYFDSAVVEVIDYIYAESITLNKTELNMKVGDCTQLSASIYPSNAEKGKNVEWSSSDDSIATVSRTGLVRAEGKGQCTIYGTLENGVFASCTVNVSDIGPVVRNNETLQNYSNAKYVYMTVNEQIPLYLNTNVTFTSTNSNVAYVSQNKLIAKGIGKTTIKATNSDGDYSQFDVYVYDCDCSFTGSTISNYLDVDCTKLISSYDVSIEKASFKNGKNLCIDFDVYKNGGVLDKFYAAFDVYDENGILVCTKVFESENPLLFENSYSFSFNIDLSYFNSNVYDMNYSIVVRDTFAR